MRHVKALSKKPALMADIPADILIQFFIGLLQAIQALFQAKAQAENPT